MESLGTGSATQIAVFIQDEEFDERDQELEESCNKSYLFPQATEMPEWIPVFNSLMNRERKFVDSLISS